MNKGFTLIELIVVIAIIAILSGIILFSVTQYISKGKDANISGNLAVLISVGEVYYGSLGNNSYNGFCDSSAVTRLPSQMPDGTVSYCNVESPRNQAWAVCAVKFSDPNIAYCVDSRGVGKEVLKSFCEEIKNGSRAVCP